MPPKKDKCKKVADCGCGCAKKTKRKRTAKPKNYAGARMVGFMGPRGEPYMAPITPMAPVVSVAPPAVVRRRSPSPAIPTGPSIRMAPIPSAPVMEQPKPAKYSRIAKPSSAVVAPAVPLVEPLGRYGNRIVGMASKPASALSDVGAKPVKEKKKALTATDVTRPVVADGVDTSGARPLKERKSITVSAPSQVPLGPDLVLPKVSRYVYGSTYNTLSNELIKKPETIKRIIKTPTVILPKEKYTPTLSSIQENVLYGSKPGTTELMPIRGGGAGMGGRPPKEPTEKAPPYEKRQ